MVKFGEYLESCVIEKYRDKYIAYEELKRGLDVAKSGKLKGHQDFYLILDRTYFVCKNFAEEWLTVLENQKEYRPTVFGEALSLHQFVTVNQEALRKMIKKHDKNIPTKKLYPTWRWKCDFGLTQRIIDVLFKGVKTKAQVDPVSPRRPGISVPLHPIEDDDDETQQSEADGHGDESESDAEEKGDGAAKKPHSLSKQSDSFVRQSTKYWVHTVDLPALCTSLAENLDVFVFGDDGKGGGSPWSFISSVYLDNATRDCYNDRIIKESGARILRLRTYDNNTNHVFVERKVHWDKWTGEQSSKDRFSIHEDQVMQLLRGHTVEVPPKSAGLRDELQKMIRDKKLYPTCRVDYNRVAFQPADHDHVRVSIDLNMRFLQERATHMEWRTPEERFLVEDEIVFPYSIVEVKLREPYISTPPKWLDQIQQSSLMHKENNFSKYIHATYAFSAMEGNTLGLRKPCWFDSMTFISPQLPIESVSLGDSGKSSKKLKGIPSSSKSTGSEYALMTDDDDDGHNGGRKLSWAAWMYRKLTRPEQSHAGDDFGKPIKVEPKTLFAAERTFLSWFNSSMFVCSFGVAVATGGNMASGVLMVGVGILLICYALLTYMRRTKALLLRQGHGYFDQYGPILLSAVAVSVFILALVL